MAERFYDNNNRIFFYPCGSESCKFLDFLVVFASAGVVVFGESGW